MPSGKPKNPYNAPKGETTFRRFSGVSDFTIKKFPILSTEIDDVAGSTTGLFKVLADAGADIHFALGRPKGDKSGKALLFLSPIKGKEQEEAARKADFVPRPD